MKTYLHSSALGKKVFTAFTVSFLFSITQSFPQAGTLDSSFGVNGKVNSSFATSSTWYTEPIAIQPDGKIIVCGSLESVPYQNHFVTARYKPNGLLDSTFGVNGVVETYFDTATYPDEYVGAYATCLMLQNDGKIVVGGYEYHPSIGPDYYALVRYQPNGKMDSTFGLNGKAVDFIGPFPKENEVYSLAIQKDGKILAGGWSDGFCVVRYKSNGIIDSSFAVNGIMRNQDIPSYGPTTLRLQSDGKIVTGASGQKSWDNDTTFFELDRLLPSGHYDSAFGINGHVFTPFLGVNNNLHSIALDGANIFAAGYAVNKDISENYIAIAKYKGTGFLDSSFGVNGKLTTKFNESGAIATKVIVQVDGKLLVVGQGESGNVLVGRLTANGIIDSSFGINGEANVNFGTNTYGSSGALQIDGKIITIGTPNISLARFKGDPISITIQKNLTTPEGNSGTTPVTFKIVLNETSTKRATVNYTTIDGTAKAGKDYVAASGTLIFGPGETTKRVTVNVIGDNVVEKNERFGLQLSNPRNAILGTLSTTICTIKNDDASFANISSKEDYATINNIKFYPNPAKDVLRIEGLNKNANTTISIVDLDGKLLTKNTTSNSACSLNVKQLTAGTYFVRIESENRIINLKFIKE